MSCITPAPIWEPPSEVTCVRRSRDGASDRRRVDRSGVEPWLRWAGGPASATPGPRSSWPRPAAFGESGFDATSLRAVASRAGVDPALVHHYFPGGKPELFNAAMAEGFDPRLILDLVLGERPHRQGGGHARQPRREHRGPLRAHVGRRRVGCGPTPSSRSPRRRRRRPKRPRGSVPSWPSGSGPSSATRGCRPTSWPVGGP